MEGHGPGSTARSEAGEQANPLLEERDQWAITVITVDIEAHGANKEILNTLSAIHNQEKN